MKKGIQKFASGGLPSPVISLKLKNLHLCFDFDEN